MARGATCTFANPPRQRLSRRRASAWLAGCKHRGCRKTPGRIGVKAGFLLDVNVLIAMAWPTHRAHEKVQEWLPRHARDGSATSLLTQTACVRTLSNPARSPEA